MLVGAAFGGRQECFQLFGGQLAELAAGQKAVESQRAELSPQDSADEGTLSFEQLTRSEEHRVGKECW